MPVLPTFFLKGHFDTYEETGFWNNDDNTGDPFLGSAYQWRITFSVTAQSHSNYTTPTPNFYTGSDVKVGDWFATGLYGKAVLVISIEDQNDFSVTAIVEDNERYNLMTDPNLQGYGMVDPGDGVFFRLNDDGMPILGPIEEFYFPSKTLADLTARFMLRNETSSLVLVNQHNHGMDVGFVITVDPDAEGQYKATEPSDLQNAIGIVTEVNVPGLDYFSYRPIGRLINNVNPPLFGSHGTIFYLDPNSPGQLTIEKPDVNPVPIYMQLDSPTRAILLEHSVESSSGSTPAKYDVKDLTTGQTEFTLPATAKNVLYMAINGIENEDFTFDTTTKVLVFDPAKTGYGVDADDEVFFIYTT